MENMNFWSRFRLTFIIARKEETCTDGTNEVDGDTFLVARDYLHEVWLYQGNTVGLFCTYRDHTNWNYKCTVTWNRPPIIHNGEIYNKTSKKGPKIPLNHLPWDGTIAKKLKSIMKCKNKNTQGLDDDTRPCTKVSSIIPSPHDQHDSPTEPNTTAIQSMIH